MNDDDCIHYYYWNQALASELYVLLHNIEICLRNRIHQALSKEVSLKAENTEQDNYAWYRHFSFGEVNQNGQVKRDKKGQDDLTETGKAFRKITHKGNRDLNLAPQIIVSKLEFGKWSYVLSAKKYGDGSLIDWNKLFPIVFPYFSGMQQDKHQVIIDRIRVANKWRNRLAHLEPVWKFGDIKDKKKNAVVLHEPQNQDEVIKRLNAELRRSMELLGWLCGDTYANYSNTCSYARLKELVSSEGLRNFSL